MSQIKLNRFLKQSDLKEQRKRAREDKEPLVKPGPKKKLLKKKQPTAERDDESVKDGWVMEDDASDHDGVDVVLSSEEEVDGCGSSAPDSASPVHADLVPEES